MKEITDQGPFLSAHAASPRWLFWDFVARHGTLDKTLILARAAVHSRQEGNASYGQFCFFKACLQVDDPLRPEKT